MQHSWACFCMNSLYMGIWCAHKIAISLALPVVLMANTVCAHVRNITKCARNEELVFETALHEKSPHGPNRELKAAADAVWLRTHKHIPCIPMTKIVIFSYAFPCKHTAASTRSIFDAFIIMPISNPIRLLLFTLLVGITTFFTIIFTQLKYYLLPVYICSERM